MAEISTTEAVLLGLLSRGEMSGYDLWRAADTSVGFFWLPAKSAIYAVLPQLEARGFARSRRVAQANRPAKKMYRITAAGQGALLGWLAEAPALERERGTLLLKLFFGDLAEPEVLIAHVRSQREEARALKQRLEALPDEGSYGTLAIKHGLEWARAMIRWANAAEAEIAARQQ
jgi:DNA-binding PadR family transcriptional regulator